ncbi:cell wall-binding repeat-containing protein [Clostridium tyrobutyricum]|uniref:cell wall-binding repeat-containing protein n=1 Tax=Clostridium tyrobutyricum TaxID=1519 RepID=UPI001C385AFA|nr:cell wall-binding repeat-containing protein [Clostridium tyrobutyricum]
MKNKKLVSLVLLASLTTTILGSGINSTDVSASSLVQVTRISGKDRYETAVNAAKANWTDGSDNAVIVNGNSYADAISASTLAKKLDAPILFTGKNSLDSNTISELKQLKPKNIYIIGGTGVVSSQIETKLSESCDKVIRIGGVSRYETNLNVAKELVDKLGTSKENVIAVSGNGFADALSVAPIAAAENQILLLTNNNQSSIQDTINFARDSYVTVVGTTNSINKTIYDAIHADKRINGGSDRFATNLNILNQFKSYLKYDKAYVANASKNTLDNQFSDALVASVLAGKNNSPLVLLDKQTSSTTVNAINYLKTNLTSSSEVDILGGNGVIPETIINSIKTAISSDNVPVEQTFTGYITTEDDYAASLGEDTAYMIYMKMMALSGLGITYKDKDGKWVFYYFDGNIATDNKDGDNGKWKFNGTGSQLNAWNIVENQIKRNNGSDSKKAVPVTLTGTLDGTARTNPGPDADGINYPVIKVQSITAN